MDCIHMHAMITNHAHTHEHPPSPLEEPESKKIDFRMIIPILTTSEICKTIGMLSKHGTTNSNVIIYKLKMK